MKKYFAGPLVEEGALIDPDNPYKVAVYLAEEVDALLKTKEKQIARQGAIIKAVQRAVR